MKVLEVSEKLQQVGAISNLSKELQISEKRVRSLVKNLGFAYNESTKVWDYSGDEESLENEIEGIVPTITHRNKTNDNNDSMNEVFTEKEIRVLKQIVSERESDIDLFMKYRIYDELSKVPTSTDAIRCAYNLSKDTNDRLKSFANARRLPLQDIVELAIINLLEKYK